MKLKEKDKFLRENSKEVRAFEEKDFRDDKGHNLATSREQYISKHRKENLLALFFEIVAGLAFIGFWGTFFYAIFNPSSHLSLIIILVPITIGFLFGIIAAQINDINYRFFSFHEREKLWKEEEKRKREEQKQEELFAANELLRVNNKLQDYYDKEGEYTEELLLDLGYNGNRIKLQTNSDKQRVLITISVSYNHFVEYATILLNEKKEAKLIKGFLTTQEERLEKEGVQVFERKDDNITYLSDQLEFATV